MEQSIFENHKAQATPGLMLGIGTIMFLFLLIAIFTINYQIELGEIEDYIEKRSECLKIANIINSVHISGPGTQVTTYTDYLITAFNSSLISVQGLAEIEEYGDTPRIAFLASEAGPTSQDFYNQVNAELEPDPDWYKACFSDLDGSGCGWSGTSWMTTAIPDDIGDLIDNLDQYNTIYLEDPTIYYTTDYIERLENWVAAGNALILSEHVMCRERSSGTYSETSYRCNPPGYDDDAWEIFGVTLYQESGAWGWPNQYNVVVVDTDESFDLVLGDQLSFEERPYIKDEVSSDGYEAEDLDLSGGYYSSTSCACSAPSDGRCARHSGSVGNEGEVTLSSFSNSTGQYDITVSYCDESDDSGDPDSYTLYVNSNPVHTWQSSDGYGDGQVWKEERVTLDINNGDEISVGAIRGSSSTYCRVDWIDISLSGSEVDNEFKPIARYRDYWRLYDSRNEPAIAYWSYGAGKIFYFGDFQVGYISMPGKDFSEVLVDLISIAYYLIAHPEQNSDITCSFSAFVPYQQAYGDIVIKNENNQIILENIGNASINST